MLRPTFLYHKVDENTAATMALLRVAIGRIAEELEETLPEGRSKSLALTHLEDCLMRAIQALALEYGDPVAFGELTGSDAEDTPC